MGAPKLLVIAFELVQALAGIASSVLALRRRSRWRMPVRHPAICLGSRGVDPAPD